MRAHSSARPRTARAWLRRPGTCQSQVGLGMIDREREKERKREREGG